MITFLTYYVILFQSPSSLDEYEAVRHEFVPYFLNYLRDQSFSLLQYSKSATPTPSKTPASLQKIAKAHNKGHNGERSSRNRVQLFHENEVKPITEPNNANSFAFTTPQRVQTRLNNLCNPVSSPRFDASPETTTASSTGHQRNWGRDKRMSVSPLTSPVDGFRSRNKYCLSDFIISNTSSGATSPIERGKNSSPQGHGRRTKNNAVHKKRALKDFPPPEEYETSSMNAWQSPSPSVSRTPHAVLPKFKPDQSASPLDGYFIMKGRRSKGSELAHESPSPQIVRSRELPKPHLPMPKFTLDDFPSLAGTPPNIRYN